MRKLFPLDGSLQYHGPRWHVRLHTVFRAKLDVRQREQCCSKCRAGLFLAQQNSRLYVFGINQTVTTGNGGANLGVSPPNEKLRPRLTTPGPQKVRQGENNNRRNKNLNRINLSAGLLKSQHNLFVTCHIDKLVAAFLLFRGREIQIARNRLP
jgi:ribosomal protein S27AE